MQEHQIAAQLYTIREFCKNEDDLRRSLEKIRNIGYQAVQVSGIAPIAPEKVRQFLDENGLVCCATHEPSATIFNDTQAVIDKLKALGCEQTALPNAGTEDLTQPDVLTSFCQRADIAGATLREAGITLSYHNHAIEFVRVGEKLILETIFDSTSPENLQAEPDVYWIHYGGGNPVEWCKRLQNRLPVIHLKDYRFTKENKPTYAEVGHGTLPMPEIIQAAEASGCQWFIVEQDTCPGDPFDSLEMSFKYLKSLV